MKVFVTGVCGQLGYDVFKELEKRGFHAIGSDIISEAPLGVKSFYQLDITDSVAVCNVLRMVAPDAVIHCAAWTAVDAAEEEKNKELVYRINAVGTENIARMCRDLHCRMMYISTDYVFDGRGTTPWNPDCKRFSPLNYYGKTKLDGEMAVSSLLDDYFIVRIAWAFGRNGDNFVKTMLRLACNHSKITVVDDQIGTPTYTPDLARLLVDMVQTQKYGYYHATNEGGYISWYEFAKEIFRQSGKDVIVVPVSTEEYGQSKAKRPANSRLDKTKLRQNGFNPLPDWKVALEDYLHQI